MTLTLRSASTTTGTTKGSALTHAEMDANWLHALQSANTEFLQSGSGANSETVQTVLRNGGKMVTSFGATGDGTTNDSAAIQEAIDAAVAAGGGYVIFPPASSGYSIGTAISMSFAADKDVSVTLIGFGRRSRLVAAAGSGIDMLTLTNTTSNARRVHFLNLFLNMNSTATGGIVMNNAAYNTVIGCEFVNAGGGKGVKLTGACGGIRVSNCYFLDGTSGSIGVSVEGTSLANQIINNYFGEGIYQGINLASGTMENIVAKNILYSIGNIGINIAGSHRNRIEGNHLREIGSHGILITSASENQIVNNTIRDYGSDANQQNGIFVTTASSTDSDDNAIKGNTFLDANAEGNSAHIRIAQTSGASNRTVIRGNSFDASATLKIQNAGTGTIIGFDNDGYLNRASGATSVADGGTVTHGLVGTPTKVRVTPTTSGEFVSVTAVSSTTFTVAIKKHDNSAGTTQTVYWDAEV